MPGVSAKGCSPLKRFMRSVNNKNLKKKQDMIGNCEHGNPNPSKQVKWKLDMRNGQGTSQAKCESVKWEMENGKWKTENGKENGTCKTKQKVEMIHGCHRRIHTPRSSKIYYPLNMKCKVEWTMQGIAHYQTPKKMPICIYSVKQNCPNWPLTVFSSHSLGANWC